jgi:hypothetical protein
MYGRNIYDPIGPISSQPALPGREEVSYAQLLFNQAQALEADVKWRTTTFDSGVMMQCAMQYGQVADAYRNAASAARSEGNQQLGYEADRKAGAMRERATGCASASSAMINAQHTKQLLKALF